MTLLLSYFAISTLILALVAIFFTEDFPEDLDSDLF